jgi:hypothetical protein
MRANLFHGLSIQAARRFIRDYSRGIGDDGACDCDPCFSEMQTVKVLTNSLLSILSGDSTYSRIILFTDRG